MSALHLSGQELWGAFIETRQSMIQKRRVTRSFGNGRSARLLAGGVAQPVIADRVEVEHHGHFRWSGPRTPRFRERRPVRRLVVANLADAERLADRPVGRQRRARGLVLGHQLIVRHVGVVLVELVEVPPQLRHPRAVPVHLVAAGLEVKVGEDLHRDEVPVIVWAWTRVTSHPSPLGTPSSAPQ
jgi:hypothetical protein